MHCADVEGRAVQALARRDALVASYHPLLARMHGAEAAAKAASERLTSLEERCKCAVSAEQAALSRVAELEGVDTARCAAESQVSNLQNAIGEVCCCLDASAYQFCSRYPLHNQSTCTCHKITF
jgi:hypothetical protein